MDCLLSGTVVKRLFSVTVITFSVKAFLRPDTVWRICKRFDGYQLLSQISVVCSSSGAQLEMDEDPNQLIEAPEDDDINDLNDETFGDYVEHCKH